MFLYRLLISLAAPFVCAIGLWRLARGAASRSDLSERLSAGAGHRGVLWIHGASNGELTAAKRLIEALRRAFPDHPLLITCNTATARDMVRDWHLPKTTARLAPLDLTWVLARFRTRWQPAALIMLENEIWPNRITTARSPVIVVSARMSEKTAETWSRFGWLARRVLPRIDRLYPQDHASGARLVGLGLPTDRLGPVAQLKSGVDQPPPDPAAMQSLRRVFSRPDTLLAASTHEGDEALILRAFNKVRATRPGLRLILAPRHPRRSPEIQALIADTGLTFAVRSKTLDPGPDCAVYLADTLGEMALWYALASVTIVGGTYSDRGGHTPFEPAQFGSALIHGPDVANFAESYAVLQKADAARQANDAEALANVIAELTDADTRQTMADRAQAALASIDRSAAIIDAIIADLARRLG